MINSSLDILYLTLAVCAFFLTVFLIWLIIYLILSVKKFHKVVNFLSKILTSASEFVTDVKQKAKGSMAYFKLFGVLTEKLINYVEKKAFKDSEVINRKTRGETKTKTKKT